MHKNPKIVDDAFLAQYGGVEVMSRTERMNRRNEVTKQLVATTYKEVEAELSQRAMETHERELKEWGLELEGVEEAEDVDLYVSSAVCQSPATNTVL